MKQRFGGLQLGRGVAAVAVVFNHSGLASQHASAYPDLPWLRYGSLGVDFFFVLSGFIIFNAHRDDPPGLWSAGNYLKKRLVRIFVPYLPICLVMIGVLLMFPGLSTGESREWNLFTSLTLLPTGGKPALPVAWTLVHEMTFYLIFLSFYFTAYAVWMVLIWVGSIIYVVATSTAVEGPWVTILSPYNLEFVCGIGAAYLSRSFRTYRPTSFAFGAMFFPAIYLIDFGVNTSSGFVLFVTFFIVATTHLEAMNYFSVPKLAVFLGDASYAIYLVHGPVISVTGRLLHNQPWPVMMASNVVIAVAVGVLYHETYERWAVVRMNQIVMRKPVSVGLLI